MKRLYFSLVTLVLLVFSVHGQEERRLIRKGNEDFTNKKYAESEEAFRKALAKNQKSYEAQFNIADALYKQDKYDEAQQAFQALAAKEMDKMRLAALNHNIGNCELAKLAKKQGQANAAAQQGGEQQGGGELDKAINSYKTSLRNNPLDNETRYNLIAAQKMKDQNQNKKQQQQQQQQQQPKQDQQQQQQQQEQTSKQDAQRILDAMQQEEKDLQNKRKVKVRGKQSDKNW